MAGRGRERREREGNRRGREERSVEGEEGKKVGTGPPIG